MSTYELDDDMVRAWLVGHPDGNLSSALKEQLPQLVPQKVGSVVRTYAGAVFVRNDCGNEFVWCEVDRGDDSPLRWFSDEELPRIVEVLSEGVELL